MTTLYHFTSTTHLPRILELGALYPTESNLNPFEEHAGPDVVWLLDTPTVDFPHGLAGSSVDKTRVRFTVETPYAIKWTEWFWVSQMHPLWRKSFMDAAGGPDAAEHWWVVPGQIRRNRWVEVVDMATGKLLVE